jgi:hypothetical protein
LTPTVEAQYNDGLVGDCTYRLHELAAYLTQAGPWRPGTASAR